MSLNAEHKLSDRDIDRIIEMAWEDRTPFEAIKHQFGLSEQDVITLMRNQMKDSNWKKWRKRVSGRKTKHAELRSDDIKRFRSSMQKGPHQNRISKKKY